MGDKLILWLEHPKAVLPIWANSVRSVSPSPPADRGVTRRCMLVDLYSVSDQIPITHFNSGHHSVLKNNCKLCFTEQGL